MKKILGLAPMDGITDMSTRYIAYKIFDKYGDKKNYELYFWTEFMSADGFLKNPKALSKHLITVKNSGKTIVQIFGANPDSLSKTAELLYKNFKNFYGIELNVGCPAKNVTKSGAGVAMLKDKKRTLKIIKHLSQIVPNFSIKTRTGLNNEDKQEQFDFLLEVSKYVKMIIVHGRTYNQEHKGEVDWNFIYRLKEKIGDNCKIVGNGGVKSYDEISKKMGNLDGIMIGQAAIGNPYIFTAYTASQSAKIDLILQHLILAGIEEYLFEEIRNGDYNLGNLEKLSKKIFVTKLDLLRLGVKLKWNLLWNMKNRYPKFSHIWFRKILFEYVSGFPSNKEFKKNIVGKDFKESLEEVKRLLK